MIGSLMALALLSAPREFDCAGPCTCDSSVLRATARLAETSEDDRNLSVAFDDHGVAVAVEMVLGPATRPGAARLEVKTWEGAAVAVRQSATEWRALESNAWLKIIHVPLRAGTYRIVAHVKMPCGDLAMRLHSIDVYPADPTSLAYWQLQAARASQDGSLEEQLQAWKKLEQMDGTDHGLDMAQAMTWAGKPFEADRLIAEFHRRNPLDYPPVRMRAFAYGPEGAVHGTRYLWGRGEPCADSDYYDVMATVAGVYVDRGLLSPDGGERARPNTYDDPAWVVAADRVDIAVSYSSQAKRPEHAKIRVSLGGSATAVSPRVVWAEQPMTAGPGMHFPSLPATHVQAELLFAVQPGPYTAQVEVELSCGILKQEVRFRAVTPVMAAPEYWLARSQVALGAREFQEALDDLDAYVRLGGEEAVSLRIQALDGLGRKREADALRKTLVRDQAPSQ